MALLPHKQILSLHAAVLSAHLASSRVALLGGINPAFVDGLPTCPNQSSQILSDLHALNSAEPLHDGTVPFRVWLGNTLALAGERSESEIFHDALLAMEAADAGTPGGSPKGPHVVDEIADELSRIGRAVLLARGDELMRNLYEVEALIARSPHHVEARLLRERIKGAVARNERRRAMARVPLSMEMRLPSRARLKNQFPGPVGIFIGREGELRELTNDLGPSGWLICGLGGMGKTALAYKLVQMLSPGYPDLQIAIDLKGTSDDPLRPGVVMAKVVSAFLPAVPLPERPEELSGLYHAVLKGQRALVLLEDARDRAQVEPLIPPAGSILVVTSCRRFDLPGLNTHSLGKLDEGDARALLQCLAPRIDSDAAGRLAELCGGVPLVLRLAGCTLFKRSNIAPETYAARLQDAHARYDEIDAAFRVSFALLDPVPQIVWSHLGLFTSEFSRHTAIALLHAFPGTTDMVDEVLDDLTAYGLLEHHPETELYSLHRAGRRLATSSLTAEDQVYAECTVKQLSERSSRNDDVGLVFRRAAELEDALSLARRTGQRQAELLYLERLADKGGGRHFAEQGLAICRELGDRSGEGRMLVKLARFYEAEPDRAIEFGEQARVVFRQLGDLREESRIVSQLRALCERANMIRRAIELGEQNLTIFQRMGDRWGERCALEDLVRLNEHLKDDRRVAEIHQQRLAIARERGLTRDEARCAWQLGLTYQRLGELDKAIAALQICVDIERATGRPEANGHAAEIEKLRASLENRIEKRET